jgi:hypothetical protein
MVAGLVAPASENTGTVTIIAETTATVKISNEILRRISG